MDYITYAINRHNEDMEEAEQMDGLGFDDIDEYRNYLAEQKEEAQIRKYEQIQEMKGN